MSNKIKEEDLTVLVLEVVSAAADSGEPVMYARGPRSDRRLREEFSKRGIKGVHESILCTLVKRLVSEGQLQRPITNDYTLVIFGDRMRAYSTYKLLPVA